MGLLVVFFSAIPRVGRTARVSRVAEKGQGGTEAPWGMARGVGPGSRVLESSLG